MLALQDLSVIGISFDGIPPQSRSVFRYEQADIIATLREIGREFPSLQFTLVATPWRLEFYLADVGGAQNVGEWLASRYLKPDGIAKLECMRYRLSGRDALKHLCALSCGVLDDCPGEPMAKDTVAEALALGEELGSVGAFMQSVFALALSAADNAQTAIASVGPVPPVGAAVLSRIRSNRQRTHAHRPTRILLAGDSAHTREIAAELFRSDAGSVFTIDHDVSKARRLATLAGGTAIPSVALNTELLLSDVIIYASDSEQPLIREGQLRRAAAVRLQGELLLIDVAEEGVSLRQRAVNQWMRRACPGGLAFAALKDIMSQVDADDILRSVARRRAWKTINEEVNAWAHGHASLLQQQRLAELYQKSEEHTSQLRPYYLPGAVMSAADIQDVALYSFRGLLHDCASWLYEPARPKNKSSVVAQTFHN